MFVVHTFKQHTLPPACFRFSYSLSRRLPQPRRVLLRSVSFSPLPLSRLSRRTFSAGAVRVIVPSPAVRVAGLHAACSPHPSTIFHAPPNANTNTSSPLHYLLFPRFFSSPVFSSRHPFYTRFTRRVPGAQLRCCFRRGDRPASPSCSGTG
jgi:hypothetical protein